MLSCCTSDLHYGGNYAWGHETYNTKRGDILMYKTMQIKRLNRDLDINTNTAMYDCNYVQSGKLADYTLLVQRH